jgi:hypothetical protein
MCDVSKIDEYVIGKCVRTGMTKDLRSVTEEIRNFNIF